MRGLGKLALRATIGGHFVGHGMQKLVGWFGGAGPEGTGEHFEQIGLRPGRESAVLAGASEAGGGLLLALGLFTPGRGQHADRRDDERDPPRPPAERPFEAGDADDALSRSVEQAGAKR